MDEQPDTTLGRRLFVAFLLCAGLAVICWKALPKAGVYVPWFVPVLGFAVILISVLARRLDSTGNDGGDEEEEDNGIAGRIGGDSGQDDEQV